MEIRTNNQPRLLLDWDQLTPKEQADFDYLDEDQRIGRDFIRYRGATYDLGNFLISAIDNPSPRARHFAGWDGYDSETYFSGVLVRYVDRDHVVMGRYY